MSLKKLTERFHLIMFSFIMAFTYLKVVFKLVYLPKHIKLFVLNFSLRTAKMKDYLHFRLS